MEMPLNMNYVLFALICVNLGVLGAFLILEIRAVRKKTGERADTALIVSGETLAKPTAQAAAAPGKKRKRMSRQEKALLEQTDRTDREDRVELDSLGDLGALLSSAGGLDRHGKPLPGPADISRRSAGGGYGNVPA